jgi:hypothetical protein
MSSVFISYRHEDDDHARAVRGLAEALRDAGAAVVLDQLAQGEEFRGGGPQEGWPAWCERNAERAQYVLGINSPGWSATWRGTAPAGEGLGCAAEIEILRDRLWLKKQVNDFFRVVSLEERPATEVPTNLVRYHGFGWPRDAGGLRQWLRVESTTPTWPIDPPLLTWGVVANHQAAREAVARQLTADGCRLLRIVAETAHGKTTFLADVEENALALSWLRCGRIDLREPGSETAAVDDLCHRLDLPIQSGIVASRLSGMMDAIRRRGDPTLLLVDTFERASPAVKVWFERALPPLLSGAVATRIVVAGQTTPSPVGFSDRQRDSPVVSLQVPSVSDWFVLAQAQNPHVQALDPAVARRRFEDFVAPLVERTANPVTRHGLLPVIASYALKGQP